MNSLNYLYRKGKLFWRYRHQNNTYYQKLKYYLSLATLNLAMAFFYFTYLPWVISQTLWAQAGTLIGLHILALVTMVQTHLVSPGYLPIISRDLDVNIERDEDSPPFNGRIYFNENYSYRLVCGDVLEQIKFCKSCNVFRPPLTTHCSQCKRCVEQMDHHCPWLGTCIGKRNYKFYYPYLTATSLLSLSTAFLIGYCWMFREDLSFLQKASSLLVMILGMAVGGMLGFLWAVHSYFVIKGVSTKTFVRSQGPTSSNSTTLISKVIGVFSQANKAPKSTGVLGEKCNSPQSVGDSTIITSSSKQLQAKGSELSDSYNLGPQITSKISFFKA